MCDVMSLGYCILCKKVRSSWLIFVALSLVASMLKVSFKHTTVLHQRLYISNSNTRRLAATNTLWNSSSFNDVTSKELSIPVANITLPSEDYYFVIEADGNRGLGNCLFKLASLKGIAAIGDKQLAFAFDTKVNKYFNLNITTHFRKFKRPKPELVVEGLIARYNPDVLNARFLAADVAMKGYFQSWKYFRNVTSIVRAMLTFKPHIKREAQKILDNQRRLYFEREKRKPILVAIHVRRGDILEERRIRHGFVTPPKEYYFNAMTYFIRKFANEHILFVVTSNDIAWAQDNIEPLAGTYTDVKFMSRDNSEGLDLAIMASCDHVIMSVGTFSWWAAWLANGLTVYYDKWPEANSMFRRKIVREDFFLPEWIPMH